MVGAYRSFPCVKSLRIWSSSSPYFSALGLNTDQNNSEYGQFLCGVSVDNWLSIKNYSDKLKVASSAFSLVCFVSWKESTCETRKNVFYFTWKVFSFLRSSSLNFSDIQRLWRHQIPMHKTRNTFYWITCEVNTVG